MGKHNFGGFAILCVLSLGVASLVYVLVKKQLRELLDEVLRLPAGSEFYFRVFAIGVFFLGLAAALETRFDLKPEDHFMEYAWRVASGLALVLQNSVWYTLGYLVLVTILVVVLRRRHE